MNPYPVEPTSNRQLYPPQGAYPPPQGAYAPQGAYPPMQPGYPAQPPVTYPAEPIVSVPPALFGGMQFIYVEDPMAELASCPSLLIRQEPEFLEKLTGCEQPNIYHVFGNSSLGFRYLFKCIENSNCCSRKFCTSSQRPLDLNIIHCNSADQLGMGYKTPFATMQKPFMCTMFCLCRPEINVVLNSTGQPVGKVRHICTVCDPTFEVYNAQSGLKYIVTANCCQCALICPGIIGKTSQGIFDILDATSNQKVGMIVKEPATMSEIVTDADSYVVNFPPTADANDKLLLTGLALMIDYQFFESDADEEHKNRNRGGRGGRGGSTSRKTISIGKKRRH